MNSQLTVCLEKADTNEPVQAAAFLVGDTKAEQAELYKLLQRGDKGVSARPYLAGPTWDKALLPFSAFPNGEALAFQAETNGGETIHVMQPVGGEPSIIGLFDTVECKIKQPIKVAIDGDRVLMQFSKPLPFTPTRIYCMAAATFNRFYTLDH